MSKVAIKGNASGTGTFTLEAPNSNVDRTLTLPDEAGTVLTSGTPLSSFPTGFANGITEADMWRLTTAFTTSAGLQGLTANFERVDDASFAKIGTGMSQSSGIWTFPSTGLYLVQMNGYFDNLTALRYVGLQLDASTDGGSNFDALSWTFDALAVANSSAYASTLNVESFVNVTNTTNVKVKFSAYCSGAANLSGDSVRNATWFKFIRLGDAQ